MSSTYSDLQYTSFPDTVQSFVTMLNMAIADAPYIHGYQQAMIDGDYDMAQYYYSQIVSGNQKMLDATKLNTLMDTCVAIERFYQSDIEPYIANLQESWENEIHQFSYLGNYSATTQYYPNNFVTFNVSGTNYVFICTLQPPVGTAPELDSNQYWRQISIKGIQGASGDNMSFRFNWNSTDVYYVQDIVTYDNALWGCEAQNQNQTPSESSIYWKLIRRSMQDIYPFSATTPLSAQTGSLWFQIL